MSFAQEYYHQLSQARNQLRDQLVQAQTAGLLDPATRNQLRAQLRRANATLRLVRQQMATR